MALFGTKKNTKATKKESALPAGQAKAAAVSTNAPSGKRDLSDIIKRARITEKAGMQQAASVYVFDVKTSATKRDISQAVKATYNVVPRAVRIVNMKSKTVRSMRTGKSGMKGGGKKAYVYLKQGETINL